MPDGAGALPPEEAAMARELRRQLRMLSPHERALYAAVLPSLIAQVEAGAAVLAANPNDDAHMRASVMLNRLDAGWFAERLEAIGRDFAVHAVLSLGATAFGKADGDPDPETVLNAAPGFVDRMRAWAKARAAELVVAISQTTMERIREAVDAALAAGRGQRPLAREIEQMVNGVGNLTARARANVIARTEGHRAGVWASDEAARATGLRYSRQWLSAEDNRVRPDHREAHGQIRGADEPFLVGGESIMRPGEGSARQAINCRCVTRVLPAPFRRRVE